MMYDGEYLNCVKNNLKLLENDGPKIISDLSGAFNNGYKLTTNEKAFFCWILLKTTGDKHNELLEQFNFCDAMIFEQIYFTYSLPVDNFDGRLIQYDYFGNEIPLHQRNKDSDLLEEWASKWEYDSKDNSLMMNPNVEDFLKAQLKETRDALKALRKKTEFKSIDDFNTNVNFKSQKKKLLLWNKWLFTKSKQFIEEIPLKQRTFVYSGKDIRIDEFSYAHILNGHYGQMSKPVYEAKSVFSELFKVEDISKNLLTLFGLVNDLGLSINSPSDRVYFEIYDKPYVVYFEDAQKNYSGKSAEKFRRVKTFYPVEALYEIENLLNNGYEKISLNDTTKVFSLPTN